MAPDARPRVLLVKGEPCSGAGAAGAERGFRLLQLPNPATGTAQQYLLTSEGLCELNRVKQAASCWLADASTFVSDGGAFLATPINAVLVLLALLGWQPDQEPGMFEEASSLLCCEAWPAAQQLLGLAQRHLPCICDVKDVHGEPFYRHSSSKTIAYLRLVAKQALAAFQSHSASSIAGLPPPDQQAYVLRFLREYVSGPWHDALLRSLGHDPAAFNAEAGVLPGTRPASASAAAAAEAPAEKKQAVGDAKEASRRKAEASRAATAAARLAKDAAGTKKISAFFTAQARK